MVRFLKWMGVACVALALWACDRRHFDALQPGVSTEADVRRELGEPENIWIGPDGVRSLEYNRQPAGQVNYMVDVDANGRMRALRQVLTPEMFGQIQPGMAVDAVRRRLGKPARVTPFPLKHILDYDWRYAGPQQTAMVFTVTFDADRRVVLRAVSLPDVEGDPQRGGG